MGWFGAAMRQIKMGDTASFIDTNDSLYIEEQRIRKNLRLCLKFTDPWWLIEAFPVAEGKIRQGEDKIIRSFGKDWVWCAMPSLIPFNVQWKDGAWD